MRKPCPLSERVAKIYPEDALAGSVTGLAEAATPLDAINSQEATTLDELFRERVRRSPDKVAYSQYDAKAQHWYGLSWADIALEVERWQVALRQQGLNKGDRVAICHANSIEWVVFDQAALRLGLVVVPLYTADRADNIAYVLANSGASLVLLNSASHWEEIKQSEEDLSSIETVLVFDAKPGNTEAKTETNFETSMPKVIEVASWLPEQGQHFERGVAEADDLATIVYTSGTTGRPKGVMLSHRNILSNAYSGMRSIAIKPSDRLLSLLPVSHMFERTVGYYAAMLSGASVTFNRSIQKLSADLQEVRPTVVISVPMILEGIHKQIHASVANLGSFQRSWFSRALKTGWHKFEYQQGIRSWHPRLLLANILDKSVAAKVRERFGGNLDFVIVGGAPLTLDVAKTFLALGVPLLQGYGLTEASPIVSVNTKTCNRPDSIGLPLRGVELALADNDEILVKGDSVMMGYWQSSVATDNIMTDIDGQSWLKTGDRGSIDTQGYVRIIGRIKDILVLANGEKLPPMDIEAALQRDPLFEQLMVLGEGRQSLAALCVLNQGEWQQLCSKQGLKSEQLNSGPANALLLKRMAKQMKQFPGYARVRRVHASLDPWTVEAGLLTPTLKIKRAELAARYAIEIDALYAEKGARKS